MAKIEAVRRGNSNWSVSKYRTIMILVASFSMSHRRHLSALQNRPGSALSVESCSLSETSGSCHWKRIESLNKAKVVHCEAVFRCNVWERIPNCIDRYHPPYATTQYTYSSFGHAVSSVAPLREAPPGSSRRPEPVQIPRIEKPVPTSIVIIRKNIQKASRTRYIPIAPTASACAASSKERNDLCGSKCTLSRKMSTAVDDSLR